MVKAEIVYFTDPFCSWCWASEPALFALRERYRDQLTIRYVMGGLVKDIAEFFDAANGIRATAEVAPHWRMVSERSGQPIDERLMLDITDPHFSTWPANVAVKAAEITLAERTQVQREDAQVALAREVAGLDVEAFRAELSGPRALAAFHEDLDTCRVPGGPRPLPCLRREWLSHDAAAASWTGPRSASAAHPRERVSPAADPGARPREHRPWPREA